MDSLIGGVSLEFKNRNDYVQTQTKLFPFPKQSLKKNDNQLQDLLEQTLLQGDVIVQRMHQMDVFHQHTDQYFSRVAGALGAAEIGPSFNGGL